MALSAPLSHADGVERPAGPQCRAGRSITANPRRRSPTWRSWGNRSHQGGGAQLGPQVQLPITSAPGWSRAPAPRGSELRHRPTCARSCGGTREDSPAATAPPLRRPLVAAEEASPFVAGKEQVEPPHGAAAAGRRARRQSRLQGWAADSSRPVPSQATSVTRTAQPLTPTGPESRSHQASEATCAHCRAASPTSPTPLPPACTLRGRRWEQLKRS
jgi:hypothetical protein